jgi:hypothetical protein
MKGDGIPLTPASGPLLLRKDLFAGTSGRRAQRTAGFGLSRGLLRSSGHFAPLGLCSLEMGVRHIQKKFQRSAARKAIAFAVVGVDPVQRAICPDSCSRRNSDGIETVEFARHGFWRHDGFPDSFTAARSGRRGFCLRHARGTTSRCHQRGQPRSQTAWILHRFIPTTKHIVCNCSISGTLVLYACLYAYYRKKREIFP